MKHEERERRKRAKEESGGASTPKSPKRGLRRKKNARTNGPRVLYTFS
jgi:hypothetical protein